MNDPFVRECAESWAKRALAEAPAENDQRIAWLYRTAFGRQPTRDEVRLLLRFTQTQSAADATAWSDVAHAIINTKEFVFIP
jgi:ethanolamine ammonia-lyase small subunit